MKEIILRDHLEHTNEPQSDSPTSPEKICSRIESDYSYVEGLGYTVLGVFLNGSQNYGLADEQSDIDTKCIVIPKFEDFCLNKKPVSTTLVLPSNEHIDVKDIRLMFDCFKKQNINFLEILFTEHKKLNPLFESLYMPILQNAELIARYNNYAFVNCMSNMNLERQKALEKVHEARIEQIKKLGYDPKELHFMMRIYEFLVRYINGVSFEECMCSKNRKFLLSVKRGYYNLKDARKIATCLAEDTVNTKNQYMLNTPLVIDSRVDVLLNKVLVEIMQQAFLLGLKEQ